MICMMHHFTMGLIMFVGRSQNMLACFMLVLLRLLIYVSWLRPLVSEWINPFFPEWILHVSWLLSTTPYVGAASAVKVQGSEK